MTPLRASEWRPDACKSGKSGGQLEQREEGGRPLAGGSGLYGLRVRSERRKKSPCRYGPEEIVLNSGWRTGGTGSVMGNRTESSKTKAKYSWIIGRPERRRNALGFYLTPWSERTIHLACEGRRADSRRLREMRLGWLSAEEKLTRVREPWQGRGESRDKELGAVRFRFGKKVPPEVPPSSSSPHVRPAPVRRPSPSSLSDTPPGSGALSCVRSSH